MKVHELWRYPVKSVGGERLPHADLGPHGLPGDRAWAVRAETEGDITWAGAIPSLMQFSATLLPDGTPALVHGPAPFLAEAASRADAASHYAAASPGDGASRSGAAFGSSRVSPGGDAAVPCGDAAMMASGRGDVGAVLSAAAGEPLSLVEHQASEPGAAVHILSTASLRSLANALPETRIDVARFRPNIVIDVDEPGFPEHQWIGRALKAGGATLRVTDVCIRCIMINQATLTASLDRRVLEWVARNLRNAFGVYATVESPGPIAVGDEVSLVN